MVDARDGRLGEQAVGLIIEVADHGELTGHIDAPDRGRVDQVPGEPVVGDEDSRR